VQDDVQPVVEGELLERHLDVLRRERGGERQPGSGRDEGKPSAMLELLAIFLAVVGRGRSRAWA
jgi:hypothetical protein